MTGKGIADQEALAVLQTMYSQPLHKLEFGDLLETLDGAISQLTREEFAGESIPRRLLSLEGLESHFELVAELDQKLSEEDEEREIEQLCNGPSCCFAVDDKLNIIAMSQAAEARIGALQGRHVNRIELRDADAAELRKTLDDIFRNHERRCRDRALFVRREESGQFEIFHTNHFRKSRIVVVSFDHLTWDAFVEDTLTRHFFLTKTECRTVRDLVEGQRPSEIAERQGRSVETVRSHIKSVQSKMNLRDTSAIIRLVCEVMTLSGRFDAVEDDDGAADVTDDQRPASPQQFARGGTHFNVTNLVGLEPGERRRTALYLHGMLQGPFLGRHLRSLCAADGLELIGPSRPGYGGTPPAGSTTKFIARSLDQIIALMDEAKAERMVLVAHMAGMQFAARFAARYPQRVSAIVSISGIVPMMSKTQLRQQNTMHRLAMLAAKYSPATMQYIAQVGERYLRAGNEIKCLRQLFARSKHDRTALDDAETASLLKRGFGHLIGDGRSAFIHDCQAGIGDWSDAFITPSHPRIFLHGKSDVAVPSISVKDAVEQRPEWTLDVVEDAGQTLIHTHADKVFGAIQGGFAVANNDAIVEV